MTDGQDATSSPRRMISRAQAEVSEDIFRLHAARATGDDERVDEAVKKLHASTLLYHRQISRYREHDAINDLWREQLDIGADISLSLDSLKDLRLRNKQTTVERFDADRNKTVRTQQEIAWTMTAEMALTVNDQLDRCAERLGFAAPPEEDDEGIIAGEI